MNPVLDARPIIVALAGSNGAGKTTFFHAHLAHSGLRFINPDQLQRELGGTADDAAQAATALRRTLVLQRESFVFETVLSDPVGDKLGFLEQAAADGYTVVLIFIGMGSAELCDERVAMRVLQGGHDVAAARVAARYPRTLENLARAIAKLPVVLVFDNSDLEQPYRKVAEYTHGKVIYLAAPAPAWLPGGQLPRLTSPLKKRMAP
ncbi:MAG: zeta toxin family protein [Deltaproteobacteria bacterium]|nr:zeta toxin family protein [Deltaproteobacteria bacterium]